jgi:hypothetical protein
MVIVESYLTNFNMVEVLVYYSLAIKVIANENLDISFYISQ